MILTPLQLTSIKTEIDGDQDLSNSATNSDGCQHVAQELNGFPAEDFIVWKTDVLSSDIVGGIVWTEFKGDTTAAQRDAFSLIMSSGKINSADLNVRQGFAAVFSGQTLANLLALAKRPATRAEKIMATGEGSDIIPATMSFEGAVTIKHISAARSL